MYSYMHALLSDKSGDAVFTCFGLWHIGYILVFLGCIALVYLRFRHRSPEEKRRAARAFLHIAFGLYIADFFLMPFAYGEIDIEKLPFHICTAACVGCFLSCHTRFFGKVRMQLALLGLISNLVYLFYPAGLMWYQIHPLSYRVAQTLAFHAAMSDYGLLTLAFDEEGLSLKNWKKDLAVLAALLLWAVVGNLLYNGEAGTYSHMFNWFFVVRDPFGLFDARVTPYLMPFLNLALFSLAELLAYGIYKSLKRKTAA